MTNVTPADGHKCPAAPQTGRALIGTRATRLMRRRVSIICCRGGDVANRHEGFYAARFATIAVRYAAPRS